jgi:hypothetical protein
VEEVEWMLPVPPVSSSIAGVEESSPEQLTIPNATLKTKVFSRSVRTGTSDQL